MSPPTAEPQQPDQLDKLIDEHFPKASAETKALIKVKAEKRQKRLEERAEHSGHPSILQQLQTAPSVEALNLLRCVITIGLRDDALGPKKFEPDKRTVAAWAQAQWDRALALLVESPTAEELNYRFNFMYLWPKSEGTAKALACIHEIVAKKLPSPTQRLLDAGITIDGIT